MEWITFGTDQFGALVMIVGGALGVGWGYLRRDK